jgi:hypothetical protein
MSTVVVPSTLNILGVDHTIRFRRGLISGSSAQAQSCDNLAELQIDPALNPSQKAEVFLHELIHTCESSLGWRLRKGGTPLAEADITALGHGLAAIFRELGIDFDFSALPVVD